MGVMKISVTLVLALSVLAALTPTSDADTVRLPVKSRQHGSVGSSAAARFERERVWTSDHFAVNAPQRSTTPGVHDFRLHSYCGDFYFTEVSFGTPPQMFELALDTSTGDLWVPNVPIGAHNVYNHDASSTYQANGSHFYNDWMGVSGYLSRDVVRIGDLTLPRLLFGEVNDVGAFGPNYNSFPFDGYFGLGLESTNMATTETLMARLIREGKLDQPMFGIHFGKGQNNGELTLGGVNASLFEGDLHFVDIAFRGDWSVMLETITVDEWSIPVKDAAMVFVSSPTIYGPTDVIDPLARRLGGSKVDDLYMIECSAPLPDVTFVIGGRAFAITKEDYIMKLRGGQCILAMFRSYEWSLGMPFLRKYYTAFDANKHRPRIGFALAV